MAVRAARLKAKNRAELSSMWRSLGSFRSICGHLIGQMLGSPPPPKKKEEVCSLKGKPP